MDFCLIIEVRKCLIIGEFVIFAIPRYSVQYGFISHSLASEIWYKQFFSDLWE